MGRLLGARRRRGWLEGPTGPRVLRLVWVGGFVELGKLETDIVVGEDLVEFWFSEWLPFPPVFGVQRLDPEREEATWLC